MKQVRLLAFVLFLAIGVLAVAPAFAGSKQFINWTSHTLTVRFDVRTGSSVHESETFEVMVSPRERKHVTYEGQDLNGIWVTGPDFSCGVQVNNRGDSNDTLLNENANFHFRNSTSGCTFLGA